MCYLSTEVANSQKHLFTHFSKEFSYYVAMLWEETSLRIVNNLEIGRYFLYSECEMKCLRGWQSGLEDDHLPILSREQRSKRWEERGPVRPQRSIRRLFSACSMRVYPLDQLIKVFSTCWKRVCPFDKRYKVNTGQTSTPHVSCLQDASSLFA